MQNLRAILAHSPKYLRLYPVVVVVVLMSACQTIYKATAYDHTPAELCNKISMLLNQTAIEEACLILRLRGKEPVQGSPEQPFAQCTPINVNLKVD
jgi:hypothetical protein